MMLSFHIIDDILFSCTETVKHTDCSIFLNMYCMLDFLSICKSLSSV